MLKGHLIFSLKFESSYFSKKFSVFKSNVRSECSYIGLADFFLVFSVKSLNICSRSILIFRGLTCVFFLISAPFYC